MPSRARWHAVAAIVVAVALFALLPQLAARAVRGAIERDSAAERARFDAGASPWSWRFRHADDVVAGQAFGGATLDAGADGLTVRATDGSPAEVGFPLARTADIRRIDELHLRAHASVPVAASVSVREAFDEPMRHAAIGVLGPDAPDLTVRLPALAWHDDAGKAVPAPRRAAMLRLGMVLPPGVRVTLQSAALLPSSGIVEPHAGSLPRGLGAEALLAWRDNQRAADPLVTFDQAIYRPAPPWTGWLLLAIYAALLGGGGWLLRRRAGRSVDLVNAALVAAGPLGFIAGLGFGPHPAVAGILIFTLGVAYAAFLTWRRAVPPWHVWVSWRGVGWPWLAIVVAGGLVAFVGHPLAWPPVNRALIYVGWAMVQQWLVLAVLAGLLDRALPRPWAVLLAALAFALLHTPNGLLMQLCFVAELGWAWWFLRHRAILPIAIAHAASALLLQAGLAGGVLRSMEVSARFLN